MSIAFARSLPSLTSPWIKVCGIASLPDLELYAAAGATHVGFNTWPRSPRCTPPGRVRSLVDACGRFGLTPVVLSVPGSYLGPDEIASLDVWVQSSTQLPKRLRGGFKGTIEARGCACSDPSAASWADVLLLDSASGSSPGGTGKTVPQSVVGRAPRPFVLAGGLNPKNVGKAIKEHLPVGVDAASGLESEPGKKEALLVAEFCGAAREAFAKIARFGGQG